MKIFVGNVCYLQRFDAVGLCASIVNAPKGFFAEIIRNYPDKEIMMTKENCFNFDFVIKDPATVDWLREQDWILNFDEYKQIPIRELAREQDMLIDELKQIVDWFSNDNNIIFRLGYLSEYTWSIFSYHYQFESINILIDYLEDKLPCMFPPGYSVDMPNRAFS